MTDGTPEHVTTTEARAGATPHVTRVVLGVGPAAGDRHFRADIVHRPLSPTSMCSNEAYHADRRRASPRSKRGGYPVSRRPDSDEADADAPRAGAAARRRVQGPAGAGDPASARVRPLAVGQPRPRRRSGPGNAAQGVGGAQALPGRDQHARLDLHHPAQPVPEPDAPRPLQGRMGRCHRRQDPRRAGQPGPPCRAGRHAARADAPAAAAARGADPGRRRRLCL